MVAEKRENLEAYALASVGLIKGIGDVIVRGFQEPHHSESKSASIAIGAGVAAVALWDRYAPETITNRMHRAEHPLIAKASVAVTALHIMNLLPEGVDPIHQFGKRSGWLQR